MIRVAAILLLFVLTLPLGGCFFVKEPILSPADGDPLPGGDGKFRLVEKNSDESKEIAVRKTSQGGFEYLVTDPKDDGATVSRIILKRVKDDLHLVQVAEPGSDIVVLAAAIGERKIQFYNLDETDLRRRLDEMGFVVVKRPLFGEHTEADEQIARLTADGRNVAVDSVALTLHGDKETIRRLAKEIIVGGAEMEPLGGFVERIE